jgi:hypothetical protein
VHRAQAVFKTITSWVVVSALLLGIPTFGQEEPSVEPEISQSTHTYDPVLIRQFFKNIEGSWLGTISFSPAIRSPERGSEFELHETGGGLIQVRSREGDEWGGSGFCTEPPHAFCADGLHGFHVKPDGLYLGVSQPRTRVTVLKSSQQSLRYKDIGSSGQDVHWQFIDSGRLLIIRVNYPDRVISSASLFIGERSEG